MKVSFCKGRLTPLNQWLSVDIESPNWRYNRESAGSTNFTKYQLKKKLLHLQRFKAKKTAKNK
jgi:hypothetical protein